MNSTIVAIAIMIIAALMLFLKNLFSRRTSQTSEALIAERAKQEEKSKRAEEDYNDAKKRFDDFANSVGKRTE